MVCAAATLVHHAHNAHFLADYPDGSYFLLRAGMNATIWLEALTGAALAWTVFSSRWAR